jgi:hypothetical protein
VTNAPPDAARIVASAAGRAIESAWRRARLGSLLTVVSDWVGILAEGHGGEAPALEFVEDADDAADVDAADAEADGAGGGAGGDAGGRRPLLLPLDASLGGRTDDSSADGEVADSWTTSRFAATRTTCHRASGAKGSRPSSSSRTAAAASAAPRHPLPPAATNAGVRPFAERNCIDSAVRGPSRKPTEPQPFNLHCGGRRVPITAAGAPRRRLSWHRSSSRLVALRVCPPPDGVLGVHAREGLRAAARALPGLVSEVGRLRIGRHVRAPGGGGRIGPTVAARLLLPRRLRRNVLRRLDALDLRAALAEIRAYREPPEAVRRVLAGVLCVLSRARSDVWRGEWKTGVLPHLRPALLTEMRDFNLAADGPDEPWLQSLAATDGLTSDEVHRRGSLAVQAMLQWLEVARLTRKSRVMAAVEA